MPTARVPSVRFLRYCCLAVLLTAAGVHGQSEVDELQRLLGEEILSPQVAVHQVKHFIVRHGAPPPVAVSAAQWTAESKKLRERLLADVVFHGWPGEWVNAPPKFEETGVIETGKGYRLRKLRYEILPGFWSAAILYEPERITGRLPAIVNVNGHVGAPGKAVEYKQKRCINFAKQGILALNLEWLSFGELSARENRHWYGAHMDLAGTHELGLFYLLMRKGIDYLWQRPDVDRARIGVTGLSGGGWQTIVLSALDERVAVSVPVAGFAATRSRVEARERGDLGDLEQSATDFVAGIDYPHLVGLRAPRPTLLVYNAEDDCCFRASMARPHIFDALRPLYRLLGKEDALDWHENLDPGNHNYQLDNRVAAYRFFAKHFGMPAVDSEIPSDDEIRSYDELVVGLPPENLTILGLARKLADGITRPAIPAGFEARKGWVDAQRTRLRAVLRFRPAELAQTWLVASSKRGGVESVSFLFETGDGLGVSAVLFKSTQAPASAPVTIVLNDAGKSSSAVEVSDRVNRGEQVVAADLLFFGDSWKKGEPESYAQILHGMGERALGMQAAQLAALTRWVRSRSGDRAVRLEVTGMRSQAVALSAAAIDPSLYSEVMVRDGIPGWGHVFDKPVEYSDAPELFCLDLFKEFDLDRLAALASPVAVKSGLSKAVSPR